MAYEPRRVAIHRSHLGTATSQRQLPFRSPFIRLSIGTRVGRLEFLLTTQVIVSALLALRSHNMSRAPLPPSPSMFPLGFLPALVALLLIASGRADTNITIDDTDPRILYQPKWSFQGNVRPWPVLHHSRTLTRTQTNITQDRFNKTTHFSAKQGATGSLTFSVELLCSSAAGLLLMSRLQGALYVYYVGYGIMDLPSPAWIPVTLQTRNGSGSMVKCDAYRPKETRAQSVLFGSDRLNTTEIYTITVTKTNDTDDNSINIDAFILTQPEGEAVSVFSPGTNFYVFAPAPASNPPS